MVSPQRERPTAPLAYLVVQILSPLRQERLRDLSCLERLHLPPLPSRRWYSAHQLDRYRQAGLILAAKAAWADRPRPQIRDLRSSLGHCWRLEYRRMLHPPCPSRTTSQSHRHCRPNEAGKLLRYYISAVAHLVDDPVFFSKARAKHCLEVITSNQQLLVRVNPLCLRFAASVHREPVPSMCLSRDHKLDVGIHCFR